ncbi:dTDP-4-dehydrorhamnose 3,5-epimerase [Sphingobacteriaceae bacterium]|nr:dTDP-4-dehydrorhamnose 3,5-epimerase [Sphingobacteriaceae bacterium]
MFNVVQTKISGCFEIQLKKIEDLRGSFTKTFHAHIFRELNLDMKFTEEFFIYSHKNVFRGMHFQNPPTATYKLVYCVHGEVTDYIVDLRVGSPTYGQYVSFELNAKSPKSIFLDKGLAHGYMVKSDFAIMQYKSSEVFDPATDGAIDYRSFDFAKDIVNPILSEKDIKAVSFEDFKNDFKF